MLDLEVPEDEVVKRHRRPPYLPQRLQPRLPRRRTTRRRPQGVCDVCGGELYQRDDDTEETVRKRLEVYHTRDRADHRLLQGQGLMVTISALGEVDGRHAARGGTSRRRSTR